MDTPVSYFYVITITYTVGNIHVNRTSTGLVHEGNPASRYSRALKNVCEEAGEPETRCSTLFYHVEQVEL